MFQWMGIILCEEFGKRLIAYFSFQSSELPSSQSMFCIHMLMFMCVCERAYAIAHYILSGGLFTHDGIVQIFPNTQMVFIFTDFHQNYQRDQNIGTYFISFLSFILHKKNSGMNSDYSTVAKCILWNYFFVFQ